VVVASVHELMSNGKVAGGLGSHPEDPTHVDLRNERRCGLEWVSRAQVICGEYWLSYGLDERSITSHLLHLSAHTRPLALRRMDWRIGTVFQLQHWAVQPLSSYTK
jgi:hypothetical protein